MKAEYYPSDDPEYQCSEEYEWSAEVYVYVNHVENTRPVDKVMIAVQKMTCERYFDPMGESESESESDESDEEEDGEVGTLKER